MKDALSNLDSLKSCINDGGLQIFKISFAVPEQRSSPKIDFLIHFRNLVDL